MRVSDDAGDVEPISAMPTRTDREPSPSYSKIQEKAISRPQSSLKSALPPAEVDSRAVALSVSFTPPRLGQYSRKDCPETLSHSPDWLDIPPATTFRCTRLSALADLLCLGLRTSIDGASSRAGRLRSTVYPLAPAGLTKRVQYRELVSDNKSEPFVMYPRNRYDVPSTGAGEWNGAIVGVFVELSLTGSWADHIHSFAEIVE
jgi:hypothetical protein